MIKFAHKWKEKMNRSKETTHSPEQTKLHDIALGRGILALSPLLVFCAFYLTCSLVSGDFYATPVTVAFLISCLYAIATTRGMSIDKRIEVVSKGAGQPNIMLMIWIFILAGAFAASAKAMGAIDATVGLALDLLPNNLIMAGIFVAACFISLSMGTSVGTIAALVPIAQGISSQTDVPLAMMVGIVVGGAYFGDNLSFISDTTIMATKTQECRMRDKFEVNSKIVIPAAIVVVIIYVFKGWNTTAESMEKGTNLLLVIPYLTVLLTAIAGVNVILVLIVGLILTALIGICSGQYTVMEWIGAMGDGIMGMAELIIVTLLAGGLMELVKRNGGIDFIVGCLFRHVRTQRLGELSIAGMVFFTNLCTANNTITILTTGQIAKEIADKCGIDRRKSASILDTFSCLAQSFIPYGAQMLIASGLAFINPIEIIPYLYYPFIMGVCTLGAILLKYPKLK